MSFQNVRPILARQLRDSLKETVSVLGDTVADAIFSYAKLKRQLKPSYLLEKIDDLDRALKELFGSGAGVLVNSCADRLSHKLQKQVRPISDSLCDLFRQVVQGFAPPNGEPNRYGNTAQTDQS